MATIADMFVGIGADVSGFTQGTDTVSREMKQMQKEMQMIQQAVGDGLIDDSTAQKAMQMAGAYQEQIKQMKQYKTQQAAIKAEFMALNAEADKYKGKTGEFMAEVEALGKKQKKMTDEMIKNNKMMQAQFVQGVGTMLARSGQSEKIAKNFDRMNNPLYRVNNQLLAITGSMENLAKQGQPTVLALKMLGPTANMKDLQDMTMLITRGLMRFQMVAMAAAIGAGLFYSSLHKAAADSVPGYQEAMNKMGAAVREAFQPMVEVFAAVMTKVAAFITKIAEMANRFNEAHPVLSKIIQGFLMLIPALILLLSPLAIGIGLINGMQAAFASVWMLIGPLVTGLGAMMGTVLLVAAAITVVVAALVLLWKKTDWFKDAVIGAWEKIKSATISVWDAVVDAVKPAIEAVVNFVTKKVNELAKWWGKIWPDLKELLEKAFKSYEKVVSTYLKDIAAVFKAVWPVIEEIVKTVWDNIKTIINGAIKIITNVIEAFINVFQGDWQGLWNNIKNIGQAALDMVVGLIKNSLIVKALRILADFVSRTLQRFNELWNRAKSAFSNGLRSISNTVQSRMNSMLNFITGLGSSFLNAGRGLIDQMARGIRNAASRVISEAREIAKKVRDLLPFSPAKEGPLSDLDKLDFGGPIAKSLKRAQSIVNPMMSDLMTLPAANVNGFGDANKEEKFINFDRMFDGAEINVRSEGDIKRLAQELYGMTNKSARNRGVNL